MLIIKSPKYKVGSCSITEIVGKEKKLRFDEGKEIEVTEEQLAPIQKLRWCEIKITEKTKIKENKDGE